MTSIEVDPSYDFWNRQLELLGERDPLEVLKATPDELRARLSTHGEDAFVRSPAPTRWSGRQVIGHLLDIEWTIGYRTRTIYSDDHPTMIGMDHDRWIIEQGHGDRSAQELIDLFAGVRAVNVDFYSRLPESAWERKGKHAEALIDVSLALYIKIHGGHDLAHLQQLDRTIVE